MRQIDAQIISLLLLARLLVLRPESGLRWQTILLEALINTLQRAKVISKSALFHYLMRQVRLRNSQEISALRWQISLMFFQEMMPSQSLQISSRYLQMDFLELQIWQLNSKEILYHFLLFRSSRIQTRSPKHWRTCLDVGELRLMLFHRVLLIHSTKSIQFMISISNPLLTPSHKAYRISLEHSLRLIIHIFHHIWTIYQINSALYGRNMFSRHWMEFLNCLVKYLRI